MTSVDFRVSVGPLSHERTRQDSTTLGVRLETFDNVRLRSDVGEFATPIRPPWLIRSGCGSRLSGTGFESRPGRIFVIEVPHIQCSKLFTSLECMVLSLVLCTKNNPWSHSIRVVYSPDFGLPSVTILPWLCRKRRKPIFTHLLHVLWQSKGLWIKHAQMIDCRHWLKRNDHSWTSLTTSSVINKSNHLIQQYHELVIVDPFMTWHYKIRTGNKEQLFLILHVNTLNFLRIISSYRHIFCLAANTFTRFSGFLLLILTTSKQ